MTEVVFTVFSCLKTYPCIHITKNAFCAKVCISDFG